ncbi:MAG: autotransporter-associated beta strand repeat-containing protein [Planctomycetota bacterium]|nr:autotransporter-associated beta strand repeat-containing protein [Planctomycetota bacterium]
MPRPTFSSRLLDGCVRLGLSIAVIVSGLPAIATPINFSGSTYTQNFQSMTGSSTSSTTNINASTMVDISTLTLSGSSASVSGWYVYGLGTANKTGINNGSSTTGAFYQLVDSATPTNRAFGSEASGPTNGFFGAVLKNTSGGTINNLALAYDAVMNRNPSTTANPYAMSYRISSAAVTSGSATGDGTFNNGAGSWTSTTLGFTTPSSGTGAPGTQAAISPLFTILNKAGNLTGMNWASDQYLYLRWSDTDDSGSDAMAGVDNFSLSVLAAQSLGWNVAGGGTWNTTTANWTTGTSTSTFTDGDQVNFGNSAGGTISLAGALAPSSLTVSATAGSYTLSGATAGDKITGSTGLTKTGAGILALSSDNDFSGGTNISGGTVRIDGAGRLGSGGITLASGATFQSTAGSAVALSNDVVIGSGGGTIDTGSQNLTVASMSSLSGLLTKSGVGNLTVNGNFVPSSGGGVSVAAGNLVLGGGPTASGIYNLGASGVLTGNLVLSGTQRMNVNDGATLSGSGQIQLPTSGALISNLSGNAGGTVSAGIGLNSTGQSFTAGSWSGATYTPGTFTSTIGATKGANTSTTGNLTISGVISGDSDLDLSNSSLSGGGGGVLTLSAQNTYTGNTTINTGTPDVAGTASIKLGIANALPTTSGVIVGTKVGIGAARLDINGFNQQVAYLADGANATVGSTKNLSIVNNGPQDATLTFGGATTPGKGFGGVIGTGGHVVNVVKTGVNTQTLTAANTYTGSTTIAEGTLALSGAGSINASPTITVAAGAMFDVASVTGGYSIANGQTLGGAGTVSGAATVAGTIAPNMNAIGTFTMGATTLAGGGGLNVQIYDAAGSAGSGWDLLTSTGDVTVPGSGSFTIRLASASSAGGAAGQAINFNDNAAGSWAMMTTAGSLVGFDASRFTVDASGFANNLAGGTFTVSDTGSSGTGLYLVFTPGSIATWDGGSGTWSESGTGWSSGTWDPSRTAVFASPTGTVTVDGTVNANNGIQFDVAGYTLTGGAIALGGANAAVNTITTAAGTTTISSDITSSNGLTKAGPGTLVATGGVAGGQASVTAGTLQVGDGGTSGTLTGDLSLAAGTLLAFNRADATSFSGNLTGSGVVRTDGSNLSLNGAIGENVAVTNAGAATVTIGGTLSGAATVTNSGSGRIDLAGSSMTTTGAISASAGTIGFGYAGLGSGPVSLSGGGKIAFDGTATTTISNPITVAASGGGINVADGDTLALSGVLTRNGLLTKGGAGTLSVATLPTSNLAVAAGKLAVAATGTLNVTTDLQPLFAGGSLSFSAANVRINVNSVQTGTGTIEFTKGGQSVAVSGASGTLSNPVALALPSGALNLGATSGNTLTVNGPISGTGGLNLAVGGSGGAGTTLLNAQSTFSGDVTVNSSTTGVHKLGVDHALPTTAGVTFGSTAGSIDLNGHAQQIAFLKGSAGGVGGIINSVAGTTSTLTVSGTGNGSYAGPIGTTGKANIALVKDGSGMMTLSGANTYSAGTLISGGTLIAGGTSAFGTGSVSLGNGAILDLASLAVANTLGNNGGTIRNAEGFSGTQTLAGTSSFTGFVGGTLNVAAGGVVKGDGVTFTGPVTLDAGAIHAPGNSPGLQSFGGGLGYAAGSRLQWELMANTAALADRGTLYDAVDIISGPLSIDTNSLLDLTFDGADSTVDWSDPFWSIQHSWLVIDATAAAASTGLFSLGIVSADSNGTALTTIRPNAAFSMIRQGSNITLDYTVAAVPEPGALSLAAIGCVLAFYGAIRRRAPR